MLCTIYTLDYLEIEVLKMMQISDAAVFLNIDIPYNGMNSNMLFSNYFSDNNKTFHSPVIFLF